jgi:hypothetical protein
LKEGGETGGGVDGGRWDRIVRGTNERMIGAGRGNKDGAITLEKVRFQ